MQSCTYLECVVNESKIDDADNKNKVIQGGKVGGAIMETVNIKGLS